MVFDELEASVHEIVVERNGQLFSVKPKAQRSRRSRRHFGPENSLFDITSLDRSEGPTDVAQHKHRYLADAAADPHDQSESGASTYSLIPWRILLW